MILSCQHSLLSQEITTILGGKFPCLSPPSVDSGIGVFSPDVCSSLPRCRHLNALPSRSAWNFSRIGRIVQEAVWFIWKSLSRSQKTQERKER
jgi:hypothetical protein